MHDPLHRPRDQLPRQLSILEACRAQPGRQDRLRQHAPDLRPAAATCGRRAASDRTRSTSTASTRWRASGTTCSTARLRPRPASLRLTNTYGPRMRVKDARQTFLGFWMRLVLEGRAVRRVGDGDAAARLHLRRRRRRRLPARGDATRRDGAGLQPRRRAAGQLAELAELLVELTAAGRWRLVPFPPDRKAHRHRRLLRATRKIRARLGWAPASRSRRGSRRSLAFYRERGARLLGA